MRRHDEVGLHQAALCRQQPADQCCGDRERWVGDDPVRTSREPQVSCIGHHDGHRRGLEAIPEESGASAVQLKGDDTYAGLHQGCSQRTESGTDIEHEIAGCESGVLYEERRPALIELVEPPPRLPVPGHGGP